MLRARRGSPEKKSVSPRWELSTFWRDEQAAGQRKTYIFEVLQEIGDCLPLAVSEDGLVQAIAGFGCMDIRQGKTSVFGRRRGIPPQQEELQMPISKAGGGLFGPASACWVGPSQQI